MSAGNRHGAAPAHKALHPHFFAKYTILRQEKSKDFDRLLKALQESYEPATPVEDLAVLRLAQVFWRIRRVDTMEAAVYESHVEQVRDQLPNAHPAAVLAAEYLSPETPALERFRSRIQKQREDLEKQAGRISKQLSDLKKQRLAESAKESRSREREQACTGTPWQPERKEPKVNERNGSVSSAAMADPEEGMETL